MTRPARGVELGRRAGEGTRGRGPWVRPPGWSAAPAAAAAARACVGQRHAQAHAQRVHRGQHRRVVHLRDRGREGWVGGQDASLLGAGAARSGARAAGSACLDTGSQPQPAAPLTASEQAGSQAEQSGHHEQAGGQVVEGQPCQRGVRKLVRRRRLKHACGRAGGQRGMAHRRAVGESLARREPLAAWLAPPKLSSPPRPPAVRTRGALGPGHGVHQCGRRLRLLLRLQHRLHLARERAQSLLARAAGIDKEEECW